MPGTQKGHAPPELWSLEQAAVWIKTPGGVPEVRNPPPDRALQFARTVQGIEGRDGNGIGLR